MNMRRPESLATGAAADGEPLAGRFLRRAANDIVVLRASIDAACRGDAAALEEVGNIGHKLHGTAAMLGFHRVSAIGEAIEQLTAGIIADLEAHGPIDESALVRQIAECIEQLAAAVAGEASAHDGAHPMPAPRRQGQASRSVG